MSVVIRGMKMPKSCDECPCYYETEGAWRNECEVFGKEYIADDYRPEWCPLVELPAQHGRLIDADALQQSIKESIDECHKWADEVEGGEMYARVSQSLGTFVECSLRIKAAPTIIEAEVSE